MSLKRLMTCLACGAILSACATAQREPIAKPVASLETVLEEANTALTVGQAEKGFALLETAGRTFPTEKAPWLRMAQLRFDSSRYGEAIVNALEALERDPDDLLAHSIVAVSGLRVASKALADLTLKNNLSGTVRTEAQDLAKLLRSALGEDVLVPSSAKSAASSRSKRASATAASKPSSGADPFSTLRK
ncbi:MAG: hypothetical protein WA191_24565 [Telluria sp.]|nr:hypothetical protein [Telluria sp.]